MRNVVCLSLVFGAIAISRAQCILHYPETASFQYTPGFYSKAPNVNFPEDYVFRISMRFAPPEGDHSYIDPVLGYRMGRILWPDQYNPNGSQQTLERDMVNLPVLWHTKAHIFQFSMLFLQPAQYKSNPKKVELEADLLGAYGYGAAQMEYARREGRTLDWGRVLEEQVNVMKTIGYDPRLTDWTNPTFHSNTETRAKIFEIGARAGFEGRFGPTLESFKLGYPGYLWMKEVVEQHLKS